MTDDSPFQFGGARKWKGFFDTDPIQKDILSPISFERAGIRQKVFAQLQLNLSSETLVHERRIYSFVDFLADFGGVLQVLTVFFAMLIGPWASFQFDFKAIQRLYLVLTKEQDLFEETEGMSQDAFKDAITQKEKQSGKQIWLSKLSFSRQLQLFMIQSLPSFC